MKLIKVYSYLFFIAASVLTAFVFSRLVRDIYIIFSINNNYLTWLKVLNSDFIAIIASCFLVLTILILRPDFFIFIEKCVYELFKIKWPSFSDTKFSTFLVIIISGFTAILIALFDAVFSRLTVNKFLLDFFV